MPNTHDILNADTVKKCDCAECGIELIGLTNDLFILEEARKRGRPIVAGRVLDRPYCEVCIRKHQDDGEGADDGPPRQNHWRRTGVSDDEAYLGGGGQAFEPLLEWRTHERN